MLYASIILFVIAAVFGLIIASAIIRKQPTPKPVVYLHGLLAASGLVILIIRALENRENLLLASLTILVIAALGGFILFARDLTKKPGPVALVVIHALAALTGVIVLFMAVAP